MRMRADLRSAVDLSQVSPGAGPFLGRQPAKGPGLRKSLAVKVPGAIADEDS